MNFKDIVNREIVNLQNCEDEPIHIPGSIQPHGFLISINTDSLIAVCSENVVDYIGYTHEQLLGKPISEIFSPAFVSELLKFKAEPNQQVKVFQHTFLNKHFSINLHASDDQLILEGEPIEVQYNESNDLFNSSKQLLSYVEDTFTLRELTNSVAIAVKSVTNYDRVMIYRFDAEYNGEVIAEAKEEHLEPFLGLHYPHTDIPPQARALYIKNQLRIIGDVNYAPVPLYKMNSDHIETLDLSLSVLRSVSPIHIQYLHNMGVGGTLTISLLHKGKLWGLIACHHYTPKYLSQEVRTTAKLHAHFITSQIDVRLLNEEYETALKVNRAAENLTSKKLGLDRTSIKDLFRDSNIIDLCNSVGVSALIDNEVYKFGNTPSVENIQKLSEFMSKFTTDVNFTTSSLSRVTKDLDFIADVFSGINYYALGNNADCIIWYRTQTIKEINWAGDPSKSIEKDKNGLSPRKSFALFTENVRDSSRVWLKSELSACFSFYNFFQVHLRSILLNEEKENQRILTEVLKETNAELENINWISTHDLQEPLRKIRMMASILIGDDFTKLPEDVQNRIVKMQSSAERMQVLISDILKYTRANNQNTIFEPVNLNALFAEIKEELHDNFEENQVTITIGDLPQISGISFLLKQLFSNLLYNSLKFIDPAKKPLIVVTSEVEYPDIENKKSETYDKISVSDNGIGFDNQYNEKIFKIFSKLNSPADYAGSGIGLALCKKIMSKHNGFITANGEPGIGATFTMYFPRPENKD